MPSPRPQTEIEGLRTAHVRLVERLAGLDDVALRQPSLLPDWTVGHVFGHLVGNADSVIRRLRGVIEGEVVDQYPRGLQGREREIEELAAMSYAAMVAAVSRSCQQVDEIVDAMPDDAWDGLSRALGGVLRPAHVVVFSRWREVEVHHVDLGLGYTPADWPADLVQRSLPDALAGLSSRAAPAAVLAWALDRGPVPVLTPWGQPGPPATTGMR